MHHQYRIFGLVIQSDIALPAIPMVSSEHNIAPDVFVRYGLPPEKLDDPFLSEALFQGNTGEFILQIHGVASYFVQNGCNIIIKPESGADEDDVLLFLMGSAMGALLHQRNVLVLHGGAIIVNNKGVLFLGPSGIGKSTLTAGFHKRGYSFLADDLCAITMINGNPAVIPGFPRLKLRPDVLTILKTEREGLKYIRGPEGFEKYFLPVSHIQDVPIPLEAVYGIETAEVDEIQIASLKGVDKINLLIANTYRFEFLQGQGRTIHHFQQCADLGAKIAIYRIIRPCHAFLLEELMNLIEENFQRI